MSKCKAVLDGDKITEIRVKVKPREGQPRDKSEPKSPDKPGKTPRATQQPK